MLCSAGLRRDRCCCCYLFFDTPMVCAIVFAFYISVVPTFAAPKAGTFVFTSIFQYGFSSRWMLMARVHFSNIWFLWFTFSAFHSRLTFPVFQRPICSSPELWFWTQKVKAVCLVMSRRRDGCYCLRSFFASINYLGSIFGISAQLDFPFCQRPNCSNCERRSIFVLFKHWIAPCSRAEKALTTTTVQPMVPPKQLLARTG